MSTKLKDLTNPATLGAWYEADIAMHMLSAPGIGKTSVATTDIPRILSDVYGEKFGVHEEVCTSIDAVDVRGFLVPSKDANGKGISYFTRPGIMPSEEYLAEHPRGIFVLDERSQAQLLTQTAMAPVVLAKKFGEHFLPKGWRVISTSNRLSDKSAVVRPPMHLINRETTIEVVFDVDSAAHWWEARGMHPMGVAYAKSHPGSFADTVPSEPKPYMTPRSYTKAWDYLAHVAGTDANGNPNMNVMTNYTQQEFVSGMIGEGAAAELFAYLKVADELDTIENILAKPSKAKCPDRLDAAYAAVQLCLHHVDNTNVEKIWEYTERLPLELQTSAAKSMLEKSGGALLNSKRLGAWIAKNRTLVINTTS